MVFWCLDTGTGVSNILIILFFAHFFVHLHAESQWKNTFDDLQEVYNTRGHGKQSKYELLRNLYEQRHDKQSTETKDSQKSQETESAETSEENDSNGKRKFSSSLRSTTNSNSNDKLDSLENILNNYREIKQILSHKHRRENKGRKDSNSDDNSSDADSFKTSNSANSSSNCSDESSNSSDESSSISSDKSSPKSCKDLEENSKRRKRHNLRRHNPKSDDSSSSSDSSNSSESNESSDESRSSVETSTNSTVVSPKQIECRGTSGHPRNENLNAFIKQFYQNKLLEGRGKISDAQQNVMSRRNALWEQLKSKIEWLNNPQNSSFDIHLIRPKNNNTQETATNYSINHENHFSVNGKWNVTKNFLLSKSETPDGKYINTMLKINKIFYNDEKNNSENSTNVATSSLAPEIQTTTENSMLNLQSDVTQTGHSTFDTPIIGNASPPGFQVNAPPGFQVNAPPGFQVNAPPGFHVNTPPGFVNNHAASNWLSPFGHVILNSGASRNINPEIEDNSGKDEAVDKSENDAAKQDKVDLSDSTESNLVSKETSEVEIVKDNSIESAGSSIESKHDSVENDNGNINKHSTTTVENKNNSGETTSETLEYKSVTINDEIRDLGNSDDIQKKSDVKQQSASVLPALELLADDLGESRLKDVLQNRNLTMDLINFILSLTKSDDTTSEASSNNNVKIKVNGDR